MTRPLRLFERPALSALLGGFEPVGKAYNMVICKDGCYAYTGVNAGEAYQNYLNTDDDHNKLSPSDLEWFSATEMKLNMALAPMPKTKAVNAA